MTGNPMNKDHVAETQWRRYRKVQDEGKYNMLDPRAQQLAGLSKETFLCIIENYEFLSQKFDETADKK